MTWDIVQEDELEKQTISEYTPLGKFIYMCDDKFQATFFSSKAAKLSLSSKARTLTLNENGNNLHISRVIFQYNLVFLQGQGTDNQALPPLCDIFRFRKVWCFFHLTSTVLSLTCEKCDQLVRSQLEEAWLQWNNLSDMEFPFQRLLGLVNR